MKDTIQKMVAKGVYPYVAAGKLIVAGAIDDVQRQYIKRHRDDLKAALPVDVQDRLTDLAVDLPVDPAWLMDVFFTPDDLTLISLGEYLAGDMRAYRDQVRQFLAMQSVRNVFHRMTYPRAESGDSPGRLGSGPPGGQMPAYPRVERMCGQWLPIKDCRGKNSDDR